jgi:hypothetical protein
MLNALTNHLTRSTFISEPTSVPTRNCFRSPPLTAPRYDQLARSNHLGTLGTLGSLVREHVGCALQPATSLLAFAFSVFFSSLFSQSATAIMESEWEKERTFEIEKVSPVYLVGALFVVPFAIYYLLNFLSPLIHRITSMRVSEVCVGV